MWGVTGPYPAGLQSYEDPTIQASSCSRPLTSVIGVVQPSQTVRRRVCALTSQKFRGVNIMPQRARTPPNIQAIFNEEDAVIGSQGQYQSLNPTYWIFIMNRRHPNGNFSASEGALDPRTFSRLWWQVEGNRGQSWKVSGGR